ncbi:uncharacterized protein LOC117332242 [Pecten maximus]|uniref:uncharacterized protein LOC117332242 n=1 Tax=Pecten maximus TaxID=6579 RepID=UPI001457F0EB|nr:uncharacterized protein LOC117332242 [Pecten maximus]
MGRKLRTRLDIIRPNLEQSVQLRNQRHGTKGRELEVGDFVMVHDYRGSKRKRSWIRGLILRKLGPVTYTEQVGELQSKRHIDQMRPCHPDCVVDGDTNKSHLHDVIDVPRYYPREQEMRAPAVVPSSESRTPSMTSTPSLKHSVTNGSRETMSKTMESIPSYDNP